MDQKRLDDAEKELRALAAANPADVGPSLDLVRFLQQVKGPAAARQELLTRIKAGGSKCSSTRSRWRNSTSRKATSPTAFNCSRSSPAAQTRVSTLLAAQVKLAEIQLQQKNFDAAETLVTEILRKDDRNTDGLKLRASIRMEQGQLDAAIADLRQALNDQPRSRRLMYCWQRRMSAADRLN